MWCPTAIVWLARNLKWAWLMWLCSLSCHFEKMDLFLRRMYRPFVWNNVKVGVNGEFAYTWMSGLGLGMTIDFRTESICLSCSHVLINFWFDLTQYYFIEGYPLNQILFRLGKWNQEIKMMGREKYGEGKEQFMIQSTSCVRHGGGSVMSGACVAVSATG